MDNLNLSREQIDTLLGVAAQRLGTSPEKLRNQLESGSLEDVMGALNNSGGSSKLTQLLSNPKAVEQLLNSPQARQLIGQILGSGGMNG